MNINQNLEKIVKKLSILKAGAIFLNAYEDKVRIATQLIFSQLPKIDFIIWIAPASFLNTADYKNIIKKHSKEVYRKIRFFTIEAISISDEKYLQLYDLCDKYRTFCIVDDSLTIKNSEAGRTKRLVSIHKKFKYRLVLSTVPLTQGLIDLYSQLKFIDSNILKMSESQFSQCFLPFYEDNYKTWKRWSTPEDEKRLIKKMQPYIYVSDIKKSNACIRFHNHRFELTPAEKASYQEEKNAFLENKYQVVFMEVVQKFQRIYTIAKNKVEALFVLLSQIKNRNEKVLVYAKYLDEIIFLKESGYFISGHYVEMTRISNKKKAIRLFENDVNVMLCTYRVDRLNLSLKNCDNIIYFSQTFDYKDKIQSLSNLHHSDENRYINVYNFWVNTGLEDLIKDNLERKCTVLKNVCRLINKEAALQL